MAVCRIRPAMRSALHSLTAMSARRWSPSTSLLVGYRLPVLPANLLIVVARDDDYFFGVLHSRVHELWSRRDGHPTARGRERLPLHAYHHLRDLPLPLAARTGASGRSARRGHRGRGAGVGGEAGRVVEPGRPSRFSGGISKVCASGRPRNVWPQRTLTALYNARPTWLDLAHRKLDVAVLDAYGWPHDVSDEEILARLLALNRERAKLPAQHEAI